MLIGSAQTRKHTLVVDNKMETTILCAMAMKMEMPILWFMTKSSKSFQCHNVFIQITVNKITLSTL